MPPTRSCSAAPAPSPRSSSRPRGDLRARRSPFRRTSRTRTRKGGPMTVEVGATARAGTVPMTRAQIGQAMSGLYISIFVAILSSTIVTNALPTIVADLHAGQSVYTWVITATLLTTTVSSPIWGKLADLVSKKLLIQISLIVFSAGSVLSGLAADSALLIAARALQGVGAGGMLASPR